MKCAQFVHASWMNYKLQCPIAALHSHNSNTSGTCTSWQHLTKHLQHNCIKNSKQSTVKEAIFWQVQDSTKCDVVVEAHCYLSISGELIVSRYVAESITMIAGRFGHVGLCQLRTKLKKLQRETSYIAITGQATQDIVHPLHQGAKREDSKGRAPLGVKPVFRPKRTLKRELMQVKSRTQEQKQTGVVYKIPCKECPEVYVGESKRTLKVRLSEHRQAVKRGDPKNGIAVHVQKTNHCINWEGATVQRRAEGFWLKRTVEAIQIKKATPNMNLDSGLLLPMVWNPVLKPPLPHI